MKVYIILLRAVNVGGHNKLKMAELKDALLKNENIDQVLTYIQSGNIILRSNLSTKQTSKLVAKIIFEHFNLDIDVISITENNWKKLSKKHNFESSAEEWKQLLVTFLYDKVDTELISETLKSLPEGEFCEPKSNILYSYYPNGYGESKFNNSFIQKKLKTQCTTRNWKTIKTLTEKLNQNYN